MILDTLKTLFQRDLDKLRTEIDAYKNEKVLWHFEKGILNSGGNLCLHLLGNLNTYIGNGLAKTNYVRMRDLEFSLKDIPKQELLRRIDEVIIVVQTGLNNLSVEQMSQDFPVSVWDKPMEMEYTLVHLATHLNYHLGQINYHRRLLDI